MRPGQKGTKKLVARFGASLRFVRYRYDSKRMKRFTTVELVVDEADWTPPPVRSVRLRIEYWERAVRKEIIAAGGKWDPNERVWLLPADRAQELGLKERIRETA
jgi:hypothetical protein